MGKVTVKFQPLHRIDEVEFVPSYCLEKLYPNISTWEFEEEKTFDDDLEIIIDKKYASYNIKLWEALLDGKPEFKIYNRKMKKWLNPNYTCSRCATECLTEYKIHVDGKTLIPLWIEDNRFCQNCFESIPNLHIGPDGQVTLKKDKT